MTLHETYMRRCLELAAKARGHVSPNPMVGALLVQEGKIIGEGYHRQHGGPHAEPIAIASVKDSKLLTSSTLYVSLEPCSHFGKTPPCAKLILDKKIPRVVVGSTDPYPEVSGRGITMLREGGVEVIENVLTEECEALNKRFFTFYRRRRPYIILKWAQSTDGFLDKIRTFGDGQQAVYLSSETTRRLVHKFRSEEDAIMVGTRTALLDNPSLTVRHWHGTHPTRIFIDRAGIVPRTHHLLNGQVETITYTSESLSEIMQDLYKRKIQSLLVEGGAALLNSFLTLGLWDEIQTETVKQCLHTGVEAPRIDLLPDSISNCKNSIISSYTNRKLPKIL